MPKQLSLSNRRRVLVHGGAGGRRATAAQRKCIAETLALGIELLQNDQSALDAVETMIRHLEESGHFNAGVGSRQQLDGRQRMDAALMEGAFLRAGAVAGLEDICHPISAARIVMEKTDHVLVISSHASKLALHFGLERLEKSTKSPIQHRAPVFRTRNAKTLALYRKMAAYETVGAVALDECGTLATGASTGGVSMMLPGRVGDSPLVGAGVYADNEAGAVSMTGLGEGIIRLAMAKHIVCAMKNGQKPLPATRHALKLLVNRVQGEAGCLVLAPDGQFAIRHVTPWMIAGHWNGRGKPFVADQFR
jgi:beta-aspartyl-peptidase (threonine type)